MKNKKLKKYNKKYWKKYYQKHKQRIKEYHKKLYKKNKAKIQAQKKIYAQTPEGIKSSRACSKRTRDKEKRTCKNCRGPIKRPRAKNHKFCCVECSSEFHNKKKKKKRGFINPIRKLNKICSVRFCKKRAVRILNKKFYCGDHGKDKKQKNEM